MVSVADPDEAVKAARLATVRPPVRSLSSALRVPALEREYVIITDLPVAIGESLKTVSETVRRAPGLKGPPGLETVCWTRSGRATVTVAPVARQLLVSLSSGTTCRSSAQARTAYRPRGVAAGVVTVRVRVALAPGARAATAWVPVRRRSPGFF